MNSATLSFPRLHVESAVAAPLPTPPCDVYGGMAQLCDAFERAVGWSLHYADDASELDDKASQWTAPLQACAGASPSYLWIARSETAIAQSSPAPLREAAALGAALADLIGELLEQQNLHWQRGAESAAPAPASDERDWPTAADAERTSPPEETCRDDARWRRELTAAHELWRNQLPPVPIYPGWEFAGWSTSKRRFGGACYDWQPLGAESFGCLLLESIEQGLPGAFTAQAIRACVRSQAEQSVQPHALLSRANRTLWTGSAGDQLAQAFFACCETSSGLVGYAAAGSVAAWHVKPREVEKLSSCRLPLGSEQDCELSCRQLLMGRGDALVVLSSRLREARDAAGRTFDAPHLASVLVDHRHLSAEELVELVRAQFELHAADANGDDQALLVVKRTE